MAKDKLTRKFAIYTDYGDFEVDLGEEDLKVEKRRRERELHKTPVKPDRKRRRQNQARRAQKGAQDE